MQLATAPPFPVARVDKARVLLADARTQVKDRLALKNPSSVAEARSDVLRAVRLLSPATRVDGLFATEMSAAVANAASRIPRSGRSTTTARPLRVPAARPTAGIPCSGLECA